MLSKVKVEVLNLNDPKNWNRWVIGYGTSSYLSDQIQVKYNKNPEKNQFLMKQVDHFHTEPIEEYYLVLEGM